MNMQANKQKGTVLIISLIMLVVLTVLGLSAMRSTSLEETMAGNMRSENVAFQAAEAGLRAGEAWLSGINSKPIPDAAGTSGIWLLDAPDTTDNDQPWWREQTGAWWSTQGRPFTTTEADYLEYIAGKDLGVQPRFIIEERGVVKDTLSVGQQQDMIGLDFYQVTARGLDMTERSEVLVRSTFARRF